MFLCSCQAFREAFTYDASPETFESHFLKGQKQLYDDYMSAMSCVRVLASQAASNTSQAGNTSGRKKGRPLKGLSLQGISLLFCLAFCLLSCCLALLCPVVLCCVVLCCGCIDFFYCVVCLSSHVALCCCVLCCDRRVLRVVWSAVVLWYRVMVWCGIVLCCAVLCSAVVLLLCCVLCCAVMCCVAERLHIKGLYGKLHDGDKILTYHQDVVIHHVVEATSATIKLVITPMQQNMSEMKVQDHKMYVMYVCMYVCKVM